MTRWSLSVVRLPSAIVGRDGETQYDPDFDEDVNPTGDWFILTLTFDDGITGLYFVDA